MQTPTMPWHARGLRFSDKRPDPFVSRLFMGLESRRASDSDGFRLEVTRMGMESHYRLADEIAPTQIFSSLGGFAVRTAWRTSDPSTAR